MIAAFLATVALGAGAASEDTAPLDAEPRVHALLAAGRWREALETAREHQGARAGDPRADSLLAEALFRAGQFDRIDALLAGRGDLPARGLATLGRLRLAQGRDQEAVGLLDAAVALAPADPQVLFAAASATVTRQVAIDRYERYLALAEGDAERRRDSARGAIRVLRALGEREVWVPCARPARVEQALERLWDPGSGAIQGFVVRARLSEGKPVPLLLDSGSGGLHVIERAARKRAFLPLAQAEAFGGGGGGRHALTHGTFAALDLGGLVFADALATVNAGEVDPTGRFHGVLGLSAFDGYRVTLDLARDRLTLEPPGGEEPAAGPSGGDPYYTLGGQWLVPVTLGRGERVLFLLDTGATATVVDLDTVARLPDVRLGEPARVSGLGGRVPGARTARGVEVAFGGAVLDASRTLAAIDLSVRGEIGGTEVAGYLGLDFFDGKRLVVDTVGRRVRVEAKAAARSRRPERQGNPR